MLDHKWIEMVLSALVSPAISCIWLKQQGDRLARHSYRVFYHSKEIPLHIYLRGPCLNPACELLC